MSEQEKILKPCPFCSRDALLDGAFVTCSSSHTNTGRCMLKNRFFTVETWDHRPIEATAETAATEYAKQVKELQEEVKRLKCCDNCENEWRD